MIPSKNSLENWQPVPLPAAVTLIGQWVTLQPLSATQHGHALWQAVVGHDAVWTWLGDGPYASETDLALALAAKETGAAARFFAIVPHEAAGKLTEAAGYASLMRFDPANGVIEVGNVMFSPSLQRTPAATEAMFLMAQYAFEQLGNRRYEWKCNALNLPSCRAAERFGFTYEGTFRQHMVIKGQNRDTAWYSILDSEWPERKRVFETWLAPENFDAEGRQRQSFSSFAKA